MTDRESYDTGFLPVENWVTLSGTLEARWAYDAGTGVSTFETRRVLPPISEFAALTITDWRYAAKIAKIL